MAKDGWEVRWNACEGSTEPGRCTVVATAIGWLSWTSELGTGSAQRLSITTKTFCATLRRLSDHRAPLPFRPLGSREAALRVAREVGRHTAQEWFALVRSTSRTCAYCRAVGRRITKDHIVPITRGGSDGIDNLAPACWPCNMEKGQMTGDEYREFRSEMYGTG